MKSEQWPGLVTNASPFAIPPTAAVEQVNLSAHVPGQVSVRGGMRRVEVVGGAPVMLDCFPYERGGKTWLIVQQPSGGIVSLESPAYGWAASDAMEPSLATQAAITSTSYTYRYVTGSEDPSSFPPPSQDTGISQCPDAMDGGLAPTASWTFVADATQCNATQPWDQLEGGSASVQAACVSHGAVLLCAGSPSQS